MNKCFIKVEGEETSGGIHLRSCINGTEEQAFLMLADLIHVLSKDYDREVFMRTLLSAMEDIEGSRK